MTTVGTRQEATSSSPARELWRLGDYSQVVTDVVGGLGPVLVEACGITAGQRVLDVAAGTGNAAIPAAERGAEVVALDITPELFEAGRREAARRGVEIEWVEGDAEQLPYEDGEFDVVMSAIGAMFAPNHQVAADELLRVCRPGGTIGMVNWPPVGAVADFFKVFGAFAPPPPPGWQPPVLWGDEEYVRGLFGERVEDLSMEEGKLVIDHFASPEEFCDYYKRNFGPTIATYASLADDPARVQELDQAALESARVSNIGPPGGNLIYELEYVVITARKVGSS